MKLGSLTAREIITIWTKRAWNYSLISLVITNDGDDDDNNIHDSEKIADVIKAG